MPKRRRQGGIFLSSSCPRSRGQFSRALFLLLMGYCILSMQCKQLLRTSPSIAKRQSSEGIRKKCQ